MPDCYKDNLILVAPIFPKFKIGKEVILKFKSDVAKEIMVRNYDVLNFKKNAEGIFEVKITPEVEKLFILEKEDNSKDGNVCMIFNVEKK